MEIQLIGLNTWLYSFDLKDKRHHDKIKKDLKSKGTITEVFINNKIGFEFKEYYNSSLNEWLNVAPY